MATCELLKYNLTYSLLKRQMNKDELRSCEFNLITLEKFADDDIIVVFKRTGTNQDRITYLCFELGGLHEWLQTKRRPNNNPYFGPDNLNFFNLPSSPLDVISKKDARDVSRRACIHFNDCSVIY